MDNLADALSGLNNYDIIAAVLDGEPFYQRETSLKNVCLLIGSEGAGISEELKNLANIKLKLPMPGKAESLNAAVAATVMMYDYVRLQEEEV